MIYINYIDYRKDPKGEEKVEYRATKKRLELLRKLEFNEKITILETEEN